LVELKKKYAREKNFYEQNAAEALGTHELNGVKPIDRQP